MEHRSQESRSSGGQRFLARFSQARFGAGVHCPRCGHRGVHRWGRAGQHQRYRCLGCTRTFNALTGTPLAYLKRFDAWPGFLDCVDHAQTVRATAGHLGVHTSTAFRWRHRYLDAVRTLDATILTREVGIGVVFFRESQKGSRRLNRPARRRAASPGTGEAFWWPVMVAMDSGRGLVAHVPVPPALDGRSLAERLLPHLDRVELVYACRGPASAAASMAGLCGIGCEADRRVTREWGARIRVYGVAVNRWLRRFRGVATRYLANYLTWEGVVSGRLRGDGVGTGRVPLLVANTSCEQRPTFAGFG